jgi:hypothetical protein
MNMFVNDFILNVGVKTTETYAAGPKSREDTRGQHGYYIDVELLPKFYCSLDS